MEIDKNSLNNDFNEANLKYMNGFGNHFASESLQDALPKNQNSP